MEWEDFGTLVLSVKDQQKVQIGDAFVKVIRGHGRQLRLMIQAPKAVRVDRKPPATPPDDLKTQKDSHVPT